MSRGVIYAMTTAVKGLVKLGKTNDFEHRMKYLEDNGYRNVSALQRAIAIEVDDYDEKETMLDEIFSRSRVGSSELFALDIELVKQLLSSFEGTQVYPVVESKSEVFGKATKAHGEVEAELEHAMRLCEVPDGKYYLRQNRKTGKGKKPVLIQAEMHVIRGWYVVPAGTVVSVVENASCPKKASEARGEYVGKDGITIDDYWCESPSDAGSFVLGTSNNGRTTWKDASGTPISVFFSSKEG